MTLAKSFAGTATTGRPHCAYYVPMIKIAQLLRAGCTVKVLLADIHAFLDNLKAPIDLVNHRAAYYRHCIRALLSAVNVPLEKLEFVLGSSYQLGAKYTMDLFRLSTAVTEHDAKRAGAEVVKQVDNAPLSGLIYPLMQTLDEEHLGVDAQFGGVDQRKIFTLATEALPRIGYKVRAHLMNPMVPGLQGGKMSASDPNSKIDILDPPEVVRKKISKAFAKPRDLTNNGLLAFIEFVLFPASELRAASLDDPPRFEVKRNGPEPPLVYHDMETMRKDYVADTLTPQLLKAAVADAINELLAPIRASFDADPDWQKVLPLAYPPEEAEKKPKKKAKDRGTRFPGAAGNAPEAAADAASAPAADADGGAAAVQKLNLQ